MPTVNNYSLPIFLLLHLLLISSVNPKPCDFDPRPKTKWHLCDCQPLTANSGKVFCRHVAWSELPSFPATGGVPETGGGRIARPYAMTSFSIVESGLAYIHQDAFKDQNIQLLDLSHNQIETINVNGFRSLESKLYQLSLNYNILPKIPAHSLTYLYQLQYLYLKGNRISNVNQETFAEVQLKNLRFLYLDENLLSHLSNFAFTRLKLQVLTLGNNRINQIQHQVFPPSLWYLSLKNNALDEIPFKSISTLQNLATLDLEGNNITTIQPFRQEHLAFSSPISLLLSNNRINHLAPHAFSNFRKLKTLDLSHNQLHRLTPTFLRNVEALETLDLSFNHLANIPYDSLRGVAKGLRTLKLEDNQFHALPEALTHLKALEILILNSNKLTHMTNYSTSFGFKQSLRELHLAFNELTRIPTSILHGMGKLEKLDLSRNKISRLDRLAFGTFDGAGTSLVHLTLSGNKIQEINDSGAFLYMSSLAYLDLSHNQISSLSPQSFARLAGLESLSLHDNHLILFPHQALKSTSKLRYLILDNNQIMTIPAHSLIALPQLKRFSAARNNIHAIGDDTFPSDILKNLDMINLAHNRIAHLSSKSFNNLSALKQIFLQGNLIVKLNAYLFHNLTNLRSIILSRNLLNHTSNLAFTRLPRLEYLNLAHNRLRRIERGALSQVRQLESLDLSHNSFEEFDQEFLKTTKSLKTLDLSFNSLATIDLSRFRHTLKKLNLRHNSFQVIPQDTLSGFTQLRQLDLSENGIVEVEPEAFYGSPRLTKISLRANYLVDLHKGTFAHQEIFSEISLSQNSIQRLETDTFSLDNLHSLDISSNKLRSVPFEALISVRNSLSRLDLRQNRISELRSGLFDGLGNLSVLILAQNQIQTIEESTFKAPHRLRHLDLSQNPITTWHPLALTELGYSIQSLNLAETGLFSIPTISPSRGIRNLNLSSNRIYQLDEHDFRRMTKLQNIDFSNNRLDKVNPVILDNLSNLKHLNLSVNALSTFTQDHLKSLHRLETLRFHDLALLHALPSESSFRYLRNLHQLFLYNIPGISQSDISTILRLLPPLRSLHVELRNVTRLKFQLHSADFRFLRDIRVYGRQLQTISAGAFQPVRGFRVHLTLTGTQIHHFPATVFHTLTRVSYLELDLSNNRLETLEPFTNPQMAPILNKHGTTLADVKLFNNPLICDCRLSWVQSWVDSLKRTLPQKDFKKITISLNNTFCMEPGLEVGRKKPLLTLKFDRIGCGNENSRKISPISMIAIHSALLLMGILSLH